MAVGGSEADIPIHAVTCFLPDFEAVSTVLVVACLGKKYVLEVRQTNIQAAKEHAAEFARRLDVLRLLEERQYDDNNISYKALLEAGGDDDLSYEAQLELEDWILEPFLPHLRAAGYQKLSSQQSWTLEQCFSSEAFCYQLNADSNALVYQKQDIRPFRDKLEVPRVAVSRVITTQQKNMLKAFKPGQLIVDWCIDKHEGPPNTTKVRYEDDHNVTAVYFFKSVVEGLEDCLSREVTVLMNIQQLQTRSEVSATVRIPSIIGYIEHDNEDMVGEVAGILLQHVDAGVSMYSLCRPIGDGVEGPSLERRNRWKRQIAKMIDWLHENHLVWGDATAHNVLIDAQDNAWLIDFKGGATYHWIDWKNRESVAGDLQGLERILAFLEGANVQNDSPIIAVPLDQMASGIYGEEYTSTVVDYSSLRQNRKRKKSDDNQ